MVRLDFLLRVGVLLLLAALIFAANPNFGKIGNLVNIVRQASIIYLLGIGMTLVIIVGGIDLSNGAVLALSSCIFALAVVNGVPIPAAMLIAIGIGILCGLANGALVVYGKIPPFIATFAMMFIARGLAYFFMHSSSIQGFDDTFRFIGTGSLLGIPILILWAGLFFALFQFLMGNTSFGINVYAIGGNVESSRLAGIRIGATTILVYALNGFLSAFAGLLFTARLNNAEPVIGGSFPLDTIAAVIIGGTSLFGGEGTLAGTFIGVLILATLLNGMNLLGIPSLWQALVTGVLILIMIALQTYTKNIGWKRAFLRG
ncbi:MAG: rbsC [Deltaproteobacteria bacterium]|nr:rbsC [Deltaproteobacteria bacterium]